MMTRTHKIAYSFLAQFVLLLILYMVATLFGAVKFLSPAEPLALSLPHNQISALSNILFNLAIVSGLLGGGVYIAAGQRPDNQAANESLLRYSQWAWTVLLALAVLAGILGLYNGRSMLELPSLLVLAQIVVMIAIGINIFLTARTTIIQVWLLGLGISTVCALMSLIMSPDYLQDRGLRLLAVGLNLNAGYTLMTLAMGYWLMHRFSNLTPAWLENDINIAAGLMVLAGISISLPPLLRFGAPEWAGTLGNIAVFAAPILYLTAAARGYKALADRNTAQTLSAHWFTLSLLLLLLGPGLLGGLMATPGVNQWTSGTRLTDLQTTLTALASAAMIFGVVNQVAAELRGHNWRIAGLAPFWLVAFGILGVALALGGAGLVQVYLERLSGIGYLDTQTALIPLYAGWVFALLVVAAGIGFYAMAFWMRRPVEMEAQ